MPTPNCPRYLQSLHSRQWWLKPTYTFQVGNIVLLKDEVLCIWYWPVAQVVLIWSWLTCQDCWISVPNEDIQADYQLSSPTCPRGPAASPPMMLRPRSPTRSRTEQNLHLEVTPNVSTNSPTIFQLQTITILTHIC